MSNPNTPAKPATAKKAPAAKKAPEPVIRVVGPAKGRRRAGRRFGPEPVEIPAKDLSAKALKALRDDPQLIVSEV